MRPRDNPFRVERVRRVRFRPQGVDWDTIHTRLDELGFRAAIAGPDGSGKTTLLEDLIPHLEEKGFRVRSAGLTLPNRTLPKQRMQELTDGLGADELIAFDGADLLRRWEWQRLKWRSRNSGGLLVTTHTRPLLPILIRCRTSFPLFRSIVEEILSARVEERDPPPPVDLREVYERHGGNVRDALRELYDLYASLC
jgi:hypothetical protein